MNKVVLIGRISQDIELKSTQSGVSVCSFGIAVQRRFKDASGEYGTDFINCVAWRNTAEFVAKYFEKGRMIALVGSIQTRKWQDKDGNNRYATEVVCDEAYFCGEKKGDTGAQVTPHAEFEEVDDGEELPF